MINIIRYLLALKGIGTKPCTRDQCSHISKGVVHYHWGWGQRQTSLTPQSGLPYCDYQPWVRA